MEAGKKQYHFKIDMTCGACSTAVMKALTKDERFPEDAIYCNWEEQKLVVTTEKDNCQDEISGYLSKWSNAN